jgi:hypothetical protein
MALDLDSPPGPPQRVLPGPTTNCEIESATSIGRSIYFVDFVPVFFTYFCTRDTGEAGKKPFSNSVNRIGRGFGHGARSDIKAKNP